VTDRRHALGLVPGLALAAAIAVVATFLGALVPVLGAPVFGIVIGAIVAAFLRKGSIVESGARFAGKRILQASIIVLGTGLSLSQVARVGVASLPVMLGTLAVALTGAWLLGNLLGVRGDIRTLIGVGTGICGASAIAAVTAVIGAAEADVAYAIGTIFTFNVAAVLLFPAFGHLLGLSQHAFGLWAGTAINDTSSVVAASYTYGSVAGAYGIVVKLTRTIMIIPISLALSIFRARRAAAPEARGPMEAGPLPAPSESAQPATAQLTTAQLVTAQPAADRPSGRTTRQPASARSLLRIVPLFILGFLAASAADSLGVLPASWHPGLSEAGVFLITVALSGIGLGTRLSTLKAAGSRPLLLGGLLWVLVGSASLLLQLVTGKL
jgi:uncharacterized integral membrane protein (TIGR00698 family)